MIKNPLQNCLRVYKSSCDISFLFFLHWETCTEIPNTKLGVDSENDEKGRVSKGDAGISGLSCKVFLINVLVLSVTKDVAKYPYIPFLFLSTHISSNACVHLSLEFWLPHRFVIYCKQRVPVSQVFTAWTWRHSHYLGLRTSPHHPHAPSSYSPFPGVPFAILFPDSSSILPFIFYPPPFI